MTLPVNRRRKEAEAGMKVKRAGMLTKLLLAILLAATVTTFLNLQVQARELAEQQAVLERQNARQRQENEALAAAIADKDDPARIADVARERLGYVAPGEIGFYDSGN